jgi:hypothetical protein
MTTAFQRNECKDFDELIQFARQDDIGKETWIPRLEDVSLETDYDTVANAWRYNAVWHGAEVKDALFSPFSFNQMCRRLKCPTKFMLSLPGAHAKSCLDYFKENDREKDVSLKTKWREDPTHEDGGFYFVRGVVSPSTALMSTTHLLEDLKPTAEEHGMRVWKAHFRPHDFHAKLIFGENINIGTIQNPDNVNLGLHVRNSEVGAGPTVIDMMLFRLVCTNGMIHMVDGESLFCMNQMNMDRADLRANLKNALHTVGTRKDTLIAQFQDAREKTVEKPYLILSRIAKKHSLGKAAAQSITEEFQRGIVTKEYAFNRISLVNAMTRYAQKLDQTSRVKLETIAGKFLFDDEILESPVLEVEKTDTDQGPQF